MISKIVHIQLLKKKMQKYLQTTYRWDYGVETNNPTSICLKILLGSKYTIETKYNNLAYLSLLTLNIIIE
jgi:hypothetical protein